jgi:hypothetical protein
MLAGSICDETDCTELVLVLMALAVAVIAVAIAIALAWVFVISAELRRRGWRAASRRTVATVAVFVAGRTLTEVAMTVPESGALLLWLVAVPPLPLLIWQRRTGRSRQSSPCSTA